MKKATVFAAALALLLSLAACGNQDNNGGPAGDNNGQVNSGTGEDGGVGGTRGNGSLTTPNNSANNSINNNAGTGTNGQVTGTRNWTGTDSRVGNDVRRAVDGVGNAVTDLVDDGRDVMSRTASNTTFERMLDNARVHDTDGVLTDGENSRW